MNVAKIETGSDLINLIEAGHTSTFTQFYITYFKQLIIASDKYIKDIPVSEELVQDVFLKLWENPYQLRDVRSLKSYLYRAVINSSINYVNRQRNIEQHHLKLAAEFPDEYMLELDEENEIIVLLHREIDRLPTQCAKVFKLSRFENLKYKEIASQLNISERTVENHIGNALKILRERFMNDESLKIRGQSYLKLFSVFLY